MRLIFALILVAGIGLAAFAANLISGYMDQQKAVIQAERAASSTKVEVVEVYAMRRAIGYGEKLTKDDIGLIQYAAPFLPDGAYTDLEQIFPEGEDVQRIVTRPMEQLEPVLAAKVTEPGASVGLVTKIAEGMRAFAIRTDATSGVSGFLRPGDRVDVYWTGALPGGSGEVTRLIQPKVEIIAIDQTANEIQTTARIASTVTVMATAQQVARLAQAQSSGRLTLALVGMSDETTSDVVEVDQRSLLGIQETAPVAVTEAPPAPKVCTVRTRRGAEVVEIPVPCTN